MKKKIILGLVGVFTLLLLGLSPKIMQSVKAEPLWKLTTEERIKKSESDIKEFQEKLDKENKAMISLQTGLSKKEVKEILKSKNIKINKLFHVYSGKKQTFTGAFFNKDQKNIDQALETYENEILAMVEGDIKQKEKEITEWDERISKLDENNEKDKEEIKSFNAYQELYEDLKQQYVDMKENGIKIYGFQVQGNNKDLLEIKSKNHVKLLEKLGEKDAEQSGPILFMEGVY